MDIRKFFVDSETPEASKRKGACLVCAQCAADVSTALLRFTVHQKKGAMIVLKK